MMGISPSLQHGQITAYVGLRHQLQAQLALQQENAFYEINRAVGETYRQTLCRLVLDNGGRVINDRQSGSVIELELEL